MWLASEEYQGRAEVDGRLYQSRVPYLGDDDRLFLLRAGPVEAALVVAAVRSGLEAFSFRMNLVY